MHVWTGARSRRAIRWLCRNRSVSRHSRIYHNIVKFIIEHDQLHQLDNVIDDLEHDNDDNNSMQSILHVQLDR